MPTLYVMQQGARLHQTSRRLRVLLHEEELHSVPLLKVDRVVLFGNIGLTTPAMRTLLSAGADVIFLDQRGRYRGRLSAGITSRADLRLNQYRHAADPQASLTLARAFVAAKVANMRLFLDRYRRRRGIDALTIALDGMKLIGQRIPKCETLPALMGLEGQASALYFGHFGLLLTNPAFTFARRTRRPPRDPVNALLSFGYTLLLRDIETAVRTVGLDPYLGFLHGIAPNRPSLALDLCEEFRCLIVDSIVMRCINNRLLGPEHFVHSAGGAPRDGLPPLGGVWLADEGKAVFVRELEARLETVFRHPVTREKVTYRRCFEIQVRLLAAGMRRGAPYRPFLAR